MKYLKCIRPWGLLVFVAAVAVVAGGWLLFVDGAVRCMIERTGTRLVGANVELDRADLTLFPAGLTLTGLKITNPEEPMKNAVEAGRIAFLIDGPNLLRRKVIVEEMDVTGVKLNTPRKTSGALSGKKTPDTKAERFLTKKPIALPSFKVPDVSEILKNEKLASLELIESLKGEIAGERGAWRSRLDGLPDKEKMEEYKRRFEKIRSSGGGGGDIGAMLGGATELVSLQKDLKKDLDGLKEAGGELDNLVKSFEKRVSEASRAPQEDLRRILKKYSVSTEGLANVSRLLLGPRAGEWTSRALRWQERLKPLIERAARKTGDRGGKGGEGGEGGAEVVRPVRGRGEYVRFKEKHPLPDLLIRKSRVSIEVPAGLITGQILNLTPDQFVLGKPLTFAFAGQDLKGLKSVKLTGALDHTRPDSPENTARFNVTGYRLVDFDLAEVEDMRLKIDSSLADLSADVSLKGRSIRAGIKAGLGALTGRAARSNSKGLRRRALRDTYLEHQGGYHRDRGRL
jgi:uncharacterized protein (TIGR03545 family)